MSLQRKQIILNEITFWKQNKLLPDHYCDFLTALYAQGELDEETDDSEAVLAKKKKSLPFLHILIGFVTVSLIVSLFLITSFAIIPLVVAGVVICLFLYITFKLSKKSILKPLLLVCIALLLLAVSFKVWDVYFFDQPAILIGLIIGNCLIWLFSGLFMRQIYFSISGILGIIFIIGYLALY